MATPHDSNTGGVIATLEEVMKNLVSHYESSNWSIGRPSVREIDVMWWLPLPPALHFTTAK